MDGAVWLLDSVDQGGEGMTQGAETFSFDTRGLQNAVVPLAEVYWADVIAVLIWDQAKYLSFLRSRITSTAAWFKGTPRWRWSILRSRSMSLLRSPSTSLARRPVFNIFLWNLFFVKRIIWRLPLLWISRPGFASDLPGHSACDLGRSSWPVLWQGPCGHRGKSPEQSQERIHQTVPASNGSWTGLVPFSPSASPGHTEGLCTQAVPQLRAVVPPAAGADLLLL